MMGLGLPIYAFLTNIASLSFLASAASRLGQRALILIATLFIAIIPSCLLLSDYLVYKIYYDSRFLDNLAYGPLDFEPGYYLLNKIWFLAGVDFSILRFAILAFIVGTKIYLFRSFSRYWWLASIAYFSLLFYPDSYLLRASLAGAVLTFVLYTECWLKNTSYSVLLILFASTFHFSALVFLLPVLLLRIITTKTALWFSLVIIMLLALFSVGEKTVLFSMQMVNLDYAQQKFELYLDSELAQSVGLLRGSVLIYLSIFIAYITKVTLTSHVDKFIAAIMVSGLVFLISFSDFGVLSERLFRYFGFAFCIGLCRVLSTLKNRQERLLIIGLAMVVLNVAPYFMTPNDIIFL